MENDPDLVAFNTSRAVQPDAERSGVVFAANDHAAKSCSVWWAGPETGFLDRMRAEARARGITLLVIRAPYSRHQLRRAIGLIADSSGRLRHLVAVVRGELATLLRDSQVRLDDVRIEYGKIAAASAKRPS